MKQTKSLSFVYNQDAHDALLQWWKDLDDSRGDRAALRRCHNPTESMSSPLTKGGQEGGQRSRLGIEKMDIVFF